MRAPRGEVTLFEGMDDALEAAFFAFIVFIAVVIGALVWFVVNIRRRPRWTGKVLLLTIAAALLVITPLVWSNQVTNVERYPARQQEYRLEFEEYSRRCASDAFFCWGKPQPPERPVVRVPLYVVLLGLGTASLVAGIRLKATDR